MNLCAAIIVAAGSSRRAGFDKLMAPLGGATVLQRTVESLAACPNISEIVLVTTEERFAAILPAVEALAPLPIHRVDGGSERHFSVAAGLSALQTRASLVAIHDGARPLIDPAQTTRCIEAALAHGAASSAHPIVETLKRSDAEGFSSDPVDRDGLWAMETPQIFYRPLITEAYEKILADGSLVTDEVSALEHIGYKTFLVENTSPNPKITLPGDMDWVNALYSSKK